MEEKSAIYFARRRTVGKIATERENAPTSNAIGFSTPILSHKYTTHRAYIANTEHAFQLRSVNVYMLGRAETASYRRQA